jgi:hypothetical protein
VGSKLYVSEVLDNIRLERVSVGVPPVECKASKVLS